MTELVLSVNELKSYYQSRVGAVKAVDGVSFSVKQEEIVGIVGESGCGKSTLALSILKLNKPPCNIEGGEVLFNGINLFNLDKEDLRKIRLSSISYIPQSSMNALNPVKKIEDQIEDGIRAHEFIDKKEAITMIETQLEAVGLPAKTSKMYPHELSGGMRQRAIIAIATALKPQLLICDEPTTALDVILQRVVLEYLQETSRKTKMSMLFITHDIAVQAEISDRLIVMYAGKIVEISNIFDLFKEALHPYTNCLIDATPSLGMKKTLVSIPGIPPSLINPPPGCRFQSRCPRSQKKCIEVEPILDQIKPGHFVACHLCGGDKDF